MKRIAAIAATAVLLLGGVTTTAQADDMTGDELNFVLAIQSSSDVIGYAPVDDVIDLGHTTCKYLRSEKPITRLVKAYWGVGMTQFDTGLLIGAAAAHLCPDELKHVKRYLANHS